MNKIGQLLDDLHDAETDLAHQYRAVAGRQAAEQDVYYLCHTLARQADQHAEQVRLIAGRFFGPDHIQTGQPATQARQRLSTQPPDVFDE